MLCIIKDIHVDACFGKNNSGAQFRHTGHCGHILDKLIIRFDADIQFDFRLGDHIVEILQMSAGQFQLLCLISFNVDSDCPQDSFQLPDAVLWLISGLTPLLALTIISESGRSELYEMAELEMATRFSLRSITLARLGVLGVANLLILGLLFPISLCDNMQNPLAAGLYIITPFLLTTFAGLYIVRKFKGQEAMYACIGAAVGISLSVFLSYKTVPFIYQERWLIFWIAAALALCIGNGKQCVAMIKRTEELAWNLS